MVPLIHNQRILVIGPAGAGKTTLIGKLRAKYDIASFDVHTLVLQIVEATQVNDIGDLLKDAYSQLVEILPTLDVQILEVANDWPEVFFEPLISTFFNGQGGVVVYVSCPEELCIRRVNQREIVTPEYRIKDQCAYDYTYFREQSSRLGIPIIEF